ncbi:hypothetical protein AAZX31_14G045700 [Glycine max]
MTRENQYNFWLVVPSRCHKRVTFYDIYQHNQPKSVMHPLLRGLLQPDVNALLFPPKATSRTY